MKIKEYKCKCGHNNFFFSNKDDQIGIYCSYCGKWLKWADKDERNLRMKQVNYTSKKINKAYVITNDGCDGSCWGAEIYLMGVFFEKDIAEEEAKKYGATVTEIDVNKIFPLVKKDEYGCMENEYYLGGYQE